MQGRLLESGVAHGAGEVPEDEHGGVLVLQGIGGIRGGVDIGQAVRSMAVDTGCLADGVGVSGDGSGVVRGHWRRSVGRGGHAAESETKRETGHLVVPLLTVRK